MKFRFIASYRGTLSCSHLCRTMGVTDRRLRLCGAGPRPSISGATWRSWPIFGMGIG